MRRLAPVCAVLRITIANDDTDSAISHTMGHLKNGWVFVTSFQDERHTTLLMTRKRSLWERITHRDAVVPIPQGRAIHLRS